MMEIDVSADDASLEGDVITFQPAVAGKANTRTIHIRNKLKYELDIEISITGGITEHTKATLKPAEKLKLSLKLNPDKNSTQPIKAKFNIKLTYVI